MRVGGQLLLAVCAVLLLHHVASLLLATPDAERTGNQISAGGASRDLFT